MSTLLLTQGDLNVESVPLHVAEFDYEVNMPTSERAEKIAQENNMVVVYARATQLFIDIDSEADYELFQKHIEILKKYYKVTEVSEAPSKSGLPKRHITVGLDRPITNTERIILQAVLGSDRLHEMLNWIQELNGDLRPILFLEKK